MTEPDRSLDLDFEEAPPDGPSGGYDAEAPFGRKKDGSPAKRRGRKPGSTGFSSGTRGPRKTSASLEAQIGGLLWTVNIPLQLIPPLQRDQLDAVEIQALAKAIDQECQRNARFRKYVETALQAQGGTSLVLVAAMMIGRRAVRHGLVPINDNSPLRPETLDAMMGGVIGFTVKKGPLDPNLFTMRQQEMPSE